MNTTFSDLIIFFIMLSAYYLHVPGNSICQDLNNTTDIMFISQTHD